MVKPDEVGASVSSCNTTSCTSSAWTFLGDMIAVFAEEDTVISHEMFENQFGGRKNHS